ncbi:hypothetical protein BCF11_1174 [Collimonas sp. PA-H2]|uniref:hypothetical protein n=1 Tax=Collimonas sp. PA-H2 TaxID=1881062 RepID=UPI000BF5CA53|nr:hypothetical protein [Collimonas sp. PA-H2]PFH08799.1 hypothetical protein BCF11_1174 [Collimonas sp. PA-H2]
MAADIVAACIGATAAVGVAVAGYWFTKKREREAELRKEKLEHYKDFVASLSGIISGESTPDDQRAFSRSCNKLNLIAPQSVIGALQAFQEEIKVSNSARSNQGHDKLMSRLFYEMRKDLQITPKDKDPDFIFGLWASGVPSKKPK